MQYIDEGESDDRDMKNDQRSIKVLLTEHTNEKTQDDERLQTGSTRVIRVVTPTVTGKSNCEESDRGQRQSVHQSDVIYAMDADGLIQSRNQSNKIAMDGGGRCMQQRKDVYLPMNASLSISTVQGCMEGDQSRDRHEELSFKVKTVDRNTSSEVSAICC